jgi:hypothetical protein
VCEIKAKGDDAAAGRVHEPDEAGDESEGLAERLDNVPSLAVSVSHVSMIA